MQSTVTGGRLSNLVTYDAVTVPIDWYNHEARLRADDGVDNVVLQVAGITCDQRPRTARFDWPTWTRTATPS